MTHICVSELSIISSPSHYLNQCWNIVKWTLGNKLHWNFNRNSYIFIQENAFEKVVWKMAAILSRSQCVNRNSGLLLFKMIECLNIPWSRFRAWIISMWQCYLTHISIENNIQNKIISFTTILWHIFRLQHHILCPKAPWWRDNYDSKRTNSCYNEFCVIFINFQIIFFLQLSRIIRPHWQHIKY